MPCRYSIDIPQELIVTTAWDRVTYAEIKAHHDKMVNDPDFDPGFNQLLDFTAVTSLQLSGEEAKKIASRKLLSTSSRRALLASSLPVLGVARLMQTYAERVEGRDTISVFHDRMSALKWLGVESVRQ